MANTNAVVDTDTTASTPLARFGNVTPEGYQYYQKLVTPGVDLSLPHAYLKWYDIYRPETPIARELVRESREFVTAEVERLRLNDELGFVLLHACRPALLLMLMTWRNTNELWESAYAKDLSQSGGFAPIPYETIHRGTYCVWELGPVWHERNAWMRFLTSPFDEAAKRAYVADRFSGLV